MREVAGRDHRAGGGRASLVHGVSAGRYRDAPRSQAKVGPEDGNIRRGRGSESNDLQTHAESMVPMRCRTQDPTRFPEWNMNDTYKRRSAVLAAGLLVCGAPAACVSAAARD